MVDKLMYDWAVFIGRMQPPHKGHLAQIEKGFKIAQRVIVVLGSNRSARNPQNPWTVDERAEMIRRSLPQVRDRLFFVSVNDYPYAEEVWLAEVQSKVGELTDNIGVQTLRRVVLIGHRKDRSSYYLDSFPQWDTKLSLEYDEELSATDVREAYFATWQTASNSNSMKRGADDILDRALHAEVWYTMYNWRGTAEYRRLGEEWQYYKDYREAWKDSPRPPTFNTVDCVVVKSGHVLMIQRKMPPGVDQLALPGGFVDPGEWLKDGAIRELKEETKIRIADDTSETGYMPQVQPYLRANIVDKEVFDAPNRSLRGRVITMAYYIKLPDAGPLPKVQGESDAKRAMWMSFRDILNRQGEIFEDHLDIIEHFIGAYARYVY